MLDPEKLKTSPSIPEAAAAAFSSASQMQASTKHINHKHPKTSWPRRSTWYQYWPPSDQENTFDKMKNTQWAYHAGGLLWAYIPQKETILINCSNQKDQRCCTETVSIKQLHDKYPWRHSDCQHCMPRSLKKALFAACGPLPLEPSANSPLPGRA